MRLSRTATAEYHRKWYADHRETRIRQIQAYQLRVKVWIQEVRGSLKCSRCPEDDVACLDFHHRDPKEKEITISRAVRNGWGRERILKEIAKCDVLCANCHRKITTRRLSILGDALPL